MKKIELLINGDHVCNIAATSKRDALQRIRASQDQKIGAIWDRIKAYPTDAPISLVNHGKL